MEFIPTELIEKINTFKQIREIYNNEYPTYETELLQKKKIAKGKSTTRIKSETFFTIDELKELGLKIGLDYKPVPYKFEGGISGKLYMLTTPTPHIFKNFDPTIYRVPDNCRSDNEKMSSKYINLKIPERLNKMFINCVNIINSMEIQIYALDIKLENYHNGSVSMLCGGCDVFIFSCRKNNFEIDFIFYDDCDWPNGSLIVNRIFNTTIQTTIEHRTSFEISDYFKSDYTDDYDKRKFLAIINGVFVDDFKNQIYGHIIRLPQLLADLTDFKIEHSNIPDEYFDTAYLSDYYIQVNSENNCCLLTPGTHTKLYLSKSVLNLRMLWSCDYYCFTYKSDTDIKKLTKCLTEYMDRIDGVYGYKENEIYYSEEYFKTKFPDLKIHLANDIDNLTGFDLYFILYGNQNDNKMSKYPIMSEDRMNTSYIMDCYGIRFYFNKNIDPDNCVLTIDSMCVDAITLANEFDENNNKTIYENKLHQFFPLVSIHQSYHNCIAIVENLILLLK